MPTVVTEAEAQALFAAMAALGERAAFNDIAEGCEVRSQLMIEAMLEMGIDPGRAWALATPGHFMKVPNPLSPGAFCYWRNHTAPTVALDDTAAGVRVIDPSLPGVRGPLTVEAWAAAAGLAPFERLARPTSQAGMLAGFADCTMRGSVLRGFVVAVPLGVPPVTDVPGSGFRLAPDPPAGPAEFSRDWLARRASRPGG